MMKTILSASNCYSQVTKKSLILLALLTLLRVTPAGAMEMDFCSDNYVNCYNNCPHFFGYQDCVYNCMYTYFSCKCILYFGGPCQGSIVSAQDPGFAFQNEVLAQYSLSGGTTGAQPTFGAGAYFLNADPYGNIDPIQIAIGPWNGSNFLSPTSVTNVEIYVIAASELANYGPTNYTSAPWTDLGPATPSSTTGLWELTWAPTNYENSVIVANVHDSARTNSGGIFTSLTPVFPQPKSPQIALAQAVSESNFLFTVIGPAGSNYAVQASSDLQHWTTKLTISNFTGQAQIIDSSSPAQKYYRAVIENPPVESAVWQGLNNSTVGSAQDYLAEPPCCVSNLSSGGQDGLSLYVTNLSSGGQDGVGITLPADSVGLQVHLQPVDPSNTLPVGAYLRAQLIGSEYGAQGEILGAVTIAKDCAVCNGTNWVISADFSPVGVNTYTVQTYADGVLNGNETGLTGTAVAVGPSPLSVDQVGDIHDGTLSIDFGTNETTVYLQGATTPITCDQIYIVPEGLVLPNPPSGLEILASGMSSFAIGSENRSLELQNLINTALGGAAEDYVTNLSSGGQDGVGIVISNLGSGGQDGISIALPQQNLTAIDVLCEDVDPNGSLPAGEYVQSGIVGTANGLVNSVLATVRMTKAGTTNYPVTADFSKLGTITF